MAPGRIGQDGEAPNTILMVDDEENVRDAVAKILTRVGYSVVSAVSAFSSCRDSPRAKS